MMPRTDGASGSGSTDTTDDSTDSDYSVTTTDTSSSDDDYVDTLDLGTQASGGGTAYDTENSVAVVDTGDTIQDAGGTTAVLAETDEEVQEANMAISDVTGELRDLADQQEEAETQEQEDLPENDPNMNLPADTEDSGEQGVEAALAGFDLPGGTVDLPGVGEVSAAVVALAVVALAVIGG